jgi:hypothetical protein
LNGVLGLEPIRVGLRRVNRQELVCKGDWTTKARRSLRGLRTAAATRHRWRRRRPVELGCVVVGLAPHCRPAFGAHVVVLVAARQDEQELPPRRRGAAAPGAEEAGRLELAEAVWPGHPFEFYTAMDLDGCERSGNADFCPSQTPAQRRQCNLTSDAATRVPAVVVGELEVNALVDT